MPERVGAVYAAGKQSKIPLLAGWTSAELGMAVAMNPQKPTASTFPEKLKEQFKDQADAAARVYPTSTDAEALQSAADLASDLFIAYSTWKWIEVHAKSAPVSRYRFDRALPEANGSNRFGAAHASDIEYSFNTLHSKKAEWTPEDREGGTGVGGYIR